MPNRLLNLRTVSRGAERLGKTAGSGVVDNESISSLSRRRFLQYSLALGGISPVAATGGDADLELIARRTADGFVIVRNGIVVWAVNTTWLQGVASCELSNTEEFAEVTLKEARLPGLNVRCAMRARMYVQDHRLRINVEHSIGNTCHDIDFDDWLSGRARLTLGSHLLPLKIKVGGYALLEQTAPAEIRLQPDLGLRCDALDAFKISGRELRGRFSECTIAPPNPADERLIDDGQSRAMRVTLGGMNTLNAYVRPAVAHRELRCPAFGTQCVVFEVQERVGHEPLTGYLTDASGKVTLTSPSRSFGGRDPHLTLISDNLTFGRVASTTPASALTARTTRVSLATDEFVLQGTCADDRPLRITEHDPGSNIVARPVRWVTGAFRDHDGISTQLHFRKESHPDQPNDITYVLDAVPWHRKRISLDDVVVEFARAEDGLWLRAHLSGLTLEQRAGRFLVAGPSGNAPHAHVRRPMLRWILPPQSFSEQAFYEAPSGWTQPQSASSNGIAVSEKTGIPYADDQAEHRQGISGAAAIKAADDARKRDDGDTENVPASALSALRVSGESVLVFVPAADSLQTFDLSLEALLDPGRWTIRVGLDALSSEAARQSVRQSGEDFGRGPFTDIELPWRIHISPNESTQFATSPIKLPASASCHPVFFLRPFAVGKDMAKGLPLRAIDSPDHYAGSWLHYGTGNGNAPNKSYRRPVDPIRTNLDEQDRNELVWLSGRWDQPALLGTANVRAVKSGLSRTDAQGDYGIYVPQPFLAQRFLLTSLGASLRSTGTWDPPSLQVKQDGATEPSALAMSVEEWTHASTTARAHFDRVVYRGFLLPFGFRVALVKMTVREVVRVKSRGWMAVPKQRYFLRVEAGDKVFPATVGQPIQSRNGFPQPERFRLKLDSDLQIFDPGDSKYDLVGLGAAAFWVRATRQDEHYPFPVVIGEDGAGTVPLVFVSNGVVHDAALVKKVVDTFNRTGTTVNAAGSRITYAPSIKTGDTRFVTHDMHVTAFLNEPLVNSALLEQQHLPPFFPILQTAKVELDAIQRATASDARQVTTVRYANLYQAVGFAHAAASSSSTIADAKGAAASTPGNPAEVFLTLVDDVALNYTGGGERSGGVATPNMKPNALSRTQGLISDFKDLGNDGSPPVSPSLRRALARSAADARRRGAVVKGAVVKGAVVNSSSSVSNAGGFGNPFASDAKLLGILPLSAFFEAVGLDALPKFIDSIDEGIGESLDQLKYAAGQFKVDVTRTAGDIRTQLNKSDFLLSDAGRTIDVDLQAVQKAAGNLNPDSPAVPAQVGLLAASVRRLSDDFQAIANHPEAFIASPELAEFVSAANKITAFVHNGLNAFLAEIGKRATTVQGEIEAFIQACQSDAGSSCNELSEQFTQSVVNQLAAHRSDFKDLQNALTTGLQARDTFLRLGRFLDVNRDLFVSGFGLQSAVAIITSNDAGPFGKALGTFVTDAAQFRTALRSDMADFDLLYSAAIRLGIAVDAIWDEAKTNDPATARQLGAPFAELARLLNTYSAQGAGASKPPGNALELINRAHRVLSRISDAVGVAQAWEGTFKANLAVQNELHNLFTVGNSIRGKLTGLISDLTTLHAALNATDSLYEVELAIDQFVVQTLQVLNDSLAPQSDDAHYALALCEGLGNLLDNRLIGRDPARTREPIAGLQSAADQIRDDLAQLAIACWAPLYAMLGPLDNLTVPTSQTVVDLLGQDFVGATTRVLGQAQLLTNQFTPAGKRQTNSTGADLLDLSRQMDMMNDVLTDWLATVQHLAATIETTTLEEITDSLNALVASLLPVKTNLDLSVNQTLSDYGGVFIATSSEAPSTPANLTLSAHVESDLIARTTTSRFTGDISNFQINLFDVILLGVDLVHFEANDGHFHLDQPAFGNISLQGSLNFVTAFQSFMNGEDGPFVDPVPNGIRAGYRMSFPITQVGPFTVQNFNFEVAIQIPFDDRAAIISVAMASADAPCLISFGVYGGGAFFAMQMAGTKLISIEASFEYGLVGGFSFPAVEGTGRVVIGIYFHLEANAAVLRGYFYAGGHATVLDFVTISADLRLSLTYSSSGTVDGEGRFHVQIGAGPFSWTLSYSVNYSTGKSAAIAEAGYATPAGVLSDSKRGSDTCVTQPQDQHVHDVSLLDAENWTRYRDAFALEDL
jgi:hypothetical protein